ncbi:MAG: phosphoribosylformimino-5-aminoimidazole carboxamide ribotide isomerase [Oscillospiraceae bacterium]|jgi:phosphoribosylformimino-5-aminoimidazole carboxamide ribotide isomerase
MKFRPCIDIHNGKVKQIVGGTLSDISSYARANFISEYAASYYAGIYKEFGLSGGHIILLNPSSSEYYESDCKQAFLALKEYSGGFQVGGGITDENADIFLEKGASHIIVTSFVFKDGQLSMKNLEKLVAKVGKDKLVLDLSCRIKDGEYYIVTDRWQKFTGIKLDKEILLSLSEYCDEFLVHAVDAEGKARGIETKLVRLLAECEKIPVTYAGGVGNFSHLELLKIEGKNRIDVTVGSALDIFGGSMSFEKVVSFCKD